MSRSWKWKAKHLEILRQKLDRKVSEKDKEIVVLRDMNRELLFKLHRIEVAWTMRNGRFIYD